MKTQKTIKASILFLAGIVLLMFSCQEKEVLKNQMIEIEGAAEFINYSTSGLAYVLKSDSVSAHKMLAAKGDLIMVADDYFFHDGTSSYQFEAIDKVLYNHGKIFSFALSNEVIVETLRKNINAVDLSQLDHLVIDENLPEDGLLLIKKITSESGAIGLVVETWSTQVVPIIETINFKWLSLSQFTNDDLNALKDVSSVQYLMLTDAADQFKNELISFPSLEVLIIDDYGFGDAISESFLLKNSHLKQVAIVNSEINQFDFIKGLEELQSLTLQIDNTPELNFVSGFENLSRLGVVSDGANNWSEIRKIDQLEWLLLSSNIKQNEFDLLLNYLPNIEVLELIACDSINSMEKLLALEQLKALTVTDTLRDLETPLKLNNLAFLSLPKSNLNDSLFAKKIEEALPNAVVVPNDGFCMGSGWVLFMLPAIVVGVMIRRRFLYKKTS